MATTDIHVKGLKELREFLDTFPAKVEQNIIRVALRAGLNVVLPVARANLGKSHRTGALARSLRVGTRAKRKQPHGYLKTSLYYGRFVEYGTAAHVISARNGGWLSFGGAFVKSVNHPGATAAPFLRPALDSQARNAVLAMAGKMQERMTEEGLNTRHIMVGGDE